MNEILDQIVNCYLQSGDFNGLPVSRIDAPNAHSHLTALIRAEKIDLVRGDGHPNPHIKAFTAEPIETQLKKIEEEGFAGCVYPTPAELKSRSAGASTSAPYTRALSEGEPQLSFRAFDLRVLEWYRNDPRFEYYTDDIHGHIYQKEGTQIGEREIIRDRLEFLEFGFAYNDEMDRGIAAFVRYLHDLPPEIQIDIHRHEIEGGYKLHPDFFRTQIIGDFPERISVYEAFLQEKHHINRLCEMIGKPHLFRTDYDFQNRPDGFGFLIRPTKKEFRDFALQLDQLLGDDINRDFFKGEIELSKILFDADGNEVKQSKGTIQLLEDWISAKFRPHDPEPMVEMYKDFRHVRKVRQKPAHKVEDNEFDQKYVRDQRELIKRAYSAVHTLRMVLENHPRTRSYEVPDHIRQAKIWMM